MPSDPGDWSNFKQLTYVNRNTNCHHKQNNIPTSHSIPFEKSTQYSAADSK